MTYTNNLIENLKQAGDEVAESKIKEEDDMLTRTASENLYPTEAAHDAEHVLIQKRAAIDVLFGGK